MVDDMHLARAIALKYVILAYLMGQFIAFLFSIVAIYGFLAKNVTRVIGEMMCFYILRAQKC